MHVQKLVIRYFMFQINNNEGDNKQFQSLSFLMQQTETNSAEAMFYQTELLRTAHGTGQRSTSFEINGHAVMVLAVIN